MGQLLLQGRGFFNDGDAHNLRNTASPSWTRAASRASTSLSNCRCQRTSLRGPVDSDDSQGSSIVGVRVARVGVRCSAAVPGRDRTGRCSHGAHRGCSGSWVCRTFAAVCRASRGGAVLFPGTLPGAAGADGVTPRNGKNCTLRAVGGVWRKTPPRQPFKNPAFLRAFGTARDMAENSSNSPCLLVASEAESSGGTRVLHRHQGLACNFVRIEE